MPSPNGFCERSRSLEQLSQLPGIGARNFGNPGIHLRTNTFTHTFTAKSDGSVEFRLVDDKGLKGKNIPNLQVTLKTDNPPQFELLSPDGDYIATNVSSIPIEYKISDDFGLNSAQFFMEFPEGEPVKLDIPIEPDTKETKFRHVLELEQYDLEVGDSIMFYAQAEGTRAMAVA